MPPLPQGFQHVVLRSLPDHSLTDVRKNAVRLTAADRARLLPGIEPRLPPAHRGKPVLTWGVPAGPHKRFAKLWAQIIPGDVILFSGAGRVFAYARVLTTATSAKASQLLWGDPDYPYLLLVGTLKPTDIPYRDLNRVAGRAPGFIIQAFDVLGYVSTAIIEAFGLT